jgi:hypothetical protein
MENKVNPYQQLLQYFLEKAKEQCKSKKRNFTLKDANECKDLLENREKVLLSSFKYLASNPLRHNDYYKYLQAYKSTGVKLKEKYFRHDLEHLKTLYERYEDDKVNPFNIDNYKAYVLFMSLKLTGNYKAEDDEIFNVTYSDNREYNPLSKIPTILRSSLPFEVMEFDIKRAFPTFIDIELNSEFRHTIYERISKQEFAMYLNCNNESKVSLEDARQNLFSIFGDKTNDVLTDARYNKKGSVFKDFTKYEKHYIDKFIDANKLQNYARLHDGIFVLKGIECKNLKFDIVEFTIKECIKPAVVNETKSFYDFNDFDNIVTSQSMYADFLIQENFKRISTPDDKILLLKNSNNVIDYFNHKTNMVSFLEDEANELNNDELRNVIARDNFNVLSQSYALIPPTELIYYKDTKTSFGLPFKNGFFYFDDVDKFEIKIKEYSEVNGFFTPHQIQTRDFIYTDEIGDYEKFIQRISTGVKEFDFNDAEQKKIVNAFYSMIGYLCHNHKSSSNTHCIIFTDEGANDETRNGGRGKSIIGLGLKEVSKTLVKGGNEFVGSYLHNYADLDKSYNLYFIDDVPANFNYNDLYTQITGSISSQKKGKPAEEIEFKDSPKFFVSSNWLIRYNEENTSTERRFIEYKIKPYYSLNFTPKDEFKQDFFDDWDLNEWNKFYSFIFRCVQYYLKNGIQKIIYDKTEDNFNAEFGLDVRLSEMARIMELIIYPHGKHDVIKAFRVTDFLTIYQRFDNPYSRDKLFTTKNTKKLIDLYLQKINRTDFKYCKRGRIWQIE